MYPEDLRYTKDHEWAQTKGELARIGVTDYAQAQLGDVVFVELPAVGRILKAGESFGTVESVKAVSDLYAPLSGEVVEINEALAKTPETINQDPHDQAWMIAVRPSDPKELDALMSATQYQEYLGQKDA
jgi:glycine cleavage system H protein